MATAGFLRSQRVPFPYCLSGTPKKSPPKNYFQRSTWIRIEECAVAVLDVGLVELDGAEPVLVEVQSGLE